MIPTKNQPTKSPPSPPKNNQNIPIVNTGVANINQPKKKLSNQKTQKSKNLKTIFFIIVIIALALAAIAGAFFLLRERQDIREKAADNKEDCEAEGE